MNQEDRDLAEALARAEHAERELQAEIERQRQIEERRRLLEEYRERERQARARLGNARGYGADRYPNLYK